MKAPSFWDNLYKRGCVVFEKRNQDSNLKKDLNFENHNTQYQTDTTLVEFIECTEWNKTPPD